MARLTAMGDAITRGDAGSLEHPIGAADRVFFMHVPKTAGTTLIQVLEQHFDEREIARWLYPTTVIEAGPDFFVRHRYFHGHVEYGLIRSLLRDAPVSLTLLRPPVERVLSQIGNHQRVTPEQLPDVPVDQLEEFRRIGLEEFLFDPPPRVRPLAANFQNLHAKLLVTEHDPARSGHLLPLLADGRYVYPTPDLEQAKRRLDSFAFVGLTERFQETLFLLAYTFGWPPAVEYRSLNVGIERPRREQLSPSMLDRLVELNRIDLALYDHGRRLFEVRYETMMRELRERYGGSMHVRRDPPPAVRRRRHPAHGSRRTAFPRAPPDPAKRQTRIRRAALRHGLAHTGSGSGARGVSMERAGGHGRPSTFRSPQSPTPGSRSRSQDTSRTPSWPPSP